MPFCCSFLVFGPGFSHDKPRSFTRIHRVVIVLKDQMLHEVVLGHTLVAHRAVVALRLTVALEGCAPSGCGQTRHGPQQGRHEHQPEQDEAAAQAAEEARAGTVLGKPKVLRHLPFAGVAEGVKVDDVGEILSAQLQVNLRAVLVFVHVNGDEVDALGVGDGAGAAVLVAVNIARTALDIHVPQHDGRVVAVGGLA